MRREFGPRDAFLLLPEFLRRWLDPFEAAIDAFVRRAAADLQSDQKILDAGAGQSRHAGCFRPDSYVAVDSRVGEPAWNYSRLSAAADLLQLPFRPGRFDAVLCIVVLEHVVDPLAVLAEFRRILKTGGAVWLITPLLWEEHQKPHDYYRFTSDGLRGLLARTGFEVEELRAIGGFFWVMGRRSINFLTFFQGSWRWLIFVLLLPFFGVLIPLCCYCLDPLDRKQHFTLGHATLAIAR